MNTNVAKSPLSWAYQAGTAPKHLAQSVALEESPVPGALHTGVTIIACLLTVFMVWAAFTNVNEVAVAQGQIIPSGYIQTVQHLEGGMVREILVEDGQLVEKGQPLLKLDDTNANADLGQMMARQHSLELQASRLRSFARDDGAVKPLTPEEQAILTSMEEARTSQQNVLNDQIAQKDKELQGIIATRAALQKNLVLIREEYAINKKMAARGSVSKMAVMSSERDKNMMEGQLAESISQENQALAARDEIVNRLQSLQADLKQEAMKNLGQIEAELAEINKSITKLQSASNRTTIDAPIRGIVKGLSVHTIGSVIEQGQTLLEIVPVDEEMMVEALVSPSDVGNLKPGQSVNIKVTAYDFARFGSVPGTLESVSASTFQSEDKKSFYKTRIKLERNYIGKNPDKNIILPGMVIQADIITGKKTILEYLLKPIHTTMQTAFQER